MSPTKRQMEALRFIRGYQLAKGYSPSVREIAAGVGLSNWSPVFFFLKALEERGHIRRRFNRNRAIEVLADIPVPRSPTGEPLYFVSVP